MIPLEIRCRKSIRLVCLVVGVWLFAGLGNAVKAYRDENPYDEAVKSQFLKEAPGKTVEYTVKTKRLQGTFTFSAHPSSGSISKISCVLKKGNGDRLVLSQAWEEVMKGKRKDAASSGESVEGFNPGYAFALKRGGAALPWVLTGLVERHEAPPAFLTRLQRRVDYNVNRLVYVETERLADLMKQPEFLVVGCRRIKESGEDLVQVDFDYPHEDLRRNEVQGGTLIVDPKRYWCLRSYNVRVKVPTGGQGTVKFSILKSRELEDFLVPVSTVLEAEAVEESVRYTNKRENTYDLSIPDSLPPDGAFTLTAYDLPEPKLTGRPLPLYFWLAIIGGCCLFFGVLFRWWTRRSDQ